MPKINLSSPLEGQGTPGVRARKDRYALMARRIRNLQRFLFLSLVATVFVSGLLWWRWSRLEVRVYQVDRFGDVRLLGAGEEVPLTSDVVTQAILSDWIRMARAVTTDAELQADMLERAQVFTVGAARQFLQEQFREGRNPFVISTRESVQVEVDWVTRQPGAGETWDVGWIETWRSRSGTTRIEKWRAWVTVERQAPKTELEMDINPVGLRIKTFDPTKRRTESER